MEESINRLPFTRQREHNDGNFASASQYLSLKRTCAGKLFKPPVRACSRHHQVKLIKSCGYIMYRLAAREQCKLAIQVIIQCDDNGKYIRVGDVADVRIPLAHPQTIPIAKIYKWDCYVIYELLLICKKWQYFRQKRKSRHLECFPVSNHNHLLMSF